LAACTRASSSVTGPSSLFWIAPIVSTMQYFAYDSRTAEHDGNNPFYLEGGDLPNPGP
jgi:hypothetical protein